MTLLVVLYVTTALWLSIYGFNALILFGIHLWRRPQDPSPPPPPRDWPHVTIQLPVYNEIHVVERLLYSVARLEYPRERLQIQVLDDSDDETSLVIARIVRYLRARGVDVEHVRREQRKGYKAGALAHGLTHARGEFIAILDADFLPPRDWLRQTVPYLVHNPRLAFVQTRWEHLNAFASPFTLAQSLALDGHFGVEQPARQVLGWPLAFNGSAGIWRKEAILDSGNWQADTLCEDLDLSYRAQMRGWRGQILTHISVPGEIPPLITAFRRQQARWATGSIQTFRKHARALIRASTLSPSARVQGILHQTSYLVHPLMLLLVLLTWPMLLLHPKVNFPLAYLGVAGLGPPLVYALAQWRLRGSLRRLWAFPIILLLGLGMAWRSTRAVLLGLFRRGNVFERTPKFRLVGRTNAWRGKRYSAGFNDIPWGEALLALYTLWGGVWALKQGYRTVAPFLFLYAMSFALMAGVTGWEQLQAPRGTSRPSYTGHRRFSSFRMLKPKEENPH